ncbi:MAG: hypothetical protein LKI59_09500 [Bacteroidales bacterium]|jgi:hypothetical protein|nr:hypothetical protein [Bacteroidales bacterium]
MFANTWTMILDWFRDNSERGKLVRDFNAAAQESFIMGTAPTLIKASISKGEKSYHHQFSNWLNTGLRIQAFKGTQLSKSDLTQIGNVVLSDAVLMRRLVVLGFDTLEVCCDGGDYGCRWQIKDFMQIEG